MKEIPLTQGKVALVDDADYEWLSQWKWYAYRNNRVWYAVRNAPRNAPYARGRPIQMHGLIMGGKGIDHINRNGLDNRRNNLRFANQSQNTHNARLSRRSTSGERGVSWNTQHHKWTAQIVVNRQHKFLGRFDSIIDAVAARMQFQKEFQPSGIKETEG